MEPSQRNRGTLVNPDADATVSGRLDTLQSQLEAASRGDESAFADLYESVAPRVYGLVLRVLRDVHQSEKVTQDVFLELWETSNRFDPTRSSALSWVMTLAHQRAVKRARSTANGSLEATTEPVMLSKTQRQALELAYLDGHTYTEVSRLLQISLDAAKALIRDGLVRLRDSTAPLATEVG